MTEKEIIHEAYLDACANWEKASDLLYTSNSNLRVEMIRLSILENEYEKAAKKKSELVGGTEKTLDLLNESDSHIRVEINHNSILREELEVAAQKKSVLFEEWERRADD